MGIFKKSFVGLFFLLMASASLQAGYSLITSWGGPGTFTTPEAVTLDGAGLVYVADTGNNQVQSGTTPTVVPLTPSPTSPTGIAIDTSGNFYIAGPNYIRKYDPSGATLWTVTTPLGISPFGIAVNNTLGRVYVSDTFLDTIYVFDLSGNPVAPTTFGTFNTPRGLAIDAANNIYVADQNNSQIQVFDSSGVQIDVWSTGLGSLPQGVAIDANAVYVTDQTVVSKFTYAGVPITTIGPFTNAIGVVVNPQGSVFVVDFSTNLATEWQQTTSAAQSTVVAAPLSIPADGTTTSTITVTLKDSTGVPISGHTVSLAQNVGASSLISLPSGPSNASGVVTFNVVNTVAETVTYTATDTTNSIVITQTASVNFTGGTIVNNPKSSVIANPLNVAANGVSFSTITVTLIDASDLPVPNHFVQLVGLNGSSVISPALGAFSNGSGKVTFQVTDTNPESVIYQATDHTQPLVLTQKPTVTFSIGVVTDPLLSTVSAAPSSVPADGVTTSTVTVTLLDFNLLPVSGHNVALTAPGFSTVISPPSGPSNLFGQVTFTVTDTVVEGAIYHARDTTDGVNIVDTATVQFTSGTVPDLNPPSSTIVASPTSLPADGVTTSTITVTVRDASNTPIAGTNVIVFPMAGSSVITPITPVTDSHGQAVFTVKDAVIETVTYGAFLVDFQDALNQLVDVSFTSVPPVPPLPPSNFQGKIVRDKCSISEKFLNVLTWSPSSDPTVIGYYIYQDGALISNTPASGPFVVVVPDCSDEKTYIYTLVSYTIDGLVSSPPLTLIFVQGHVFLK
jgi:DNA-binding beta-propeller fold protein YncE